MEDDGRLQETYVAATCLLASAWESLKGKLDAQKLSSIKQNISQIQSLCLVMDRLLQSLSSSDGNRDIWITRVESVAEEVKSLKERFASVRVSETEDTTGLGEDLARDLQSKYRRVYIHDEMLAATLSHLYKMSALQERLRYDPDIFVHIGLADYIPRPIRDAIAGVSLEKALLVSVFMVAVGLVLGLLTR